MLDHGIENSWNIVDFNIFREAVFVDEGESSPVDGGKNMGILIFDMSKRGAIGPLFGFAVAGGNIGENDAWLIHGAVNSVNDHPGGF